MGKIAVALLAFVGIAVFLTASAIVNGWVLGILWGWFIIPVFALPALNIPQAIGLGIVVSWLTYHYEKSDDNTDWVHAVTTVIMRPIIVLLLGYIVTLYL